MPRSLLLLGLFAPAPAYAATLDVDASGSGSYTSIQDAIDDATSGDSIEVAPGTYAESINFSGKELQIYSTGGSGVTLLDAAGGASYAVTATSGEGAGTRLEGFTVRNGSAAGVYLANSELSLVDVVLDGLGNTGLSGGAIYATGATLDLQDSVIDGATADAGTVYATGSTITASNVTFSNNYACHGSAMAADTSDLTFTDVTITGNENHDGGTLYFDNAVTFDATNFVLTDNVAGYGSGSALYATTHTTITLDGGRIEDNLSTYASSGYYGALWVEANSTLDVTGVSFARNEGYGGGAATIYSSSSASFDSCTFEDHSLTDNGVLHVSTSADLVVTNSSFTGNTTGGSGAAISTSSSTTIAVSDTSFADNVASAYGGAAHLYDDNESTFTDVTFDGNEAADGGAIYTDQTSGTLTLERVDFDGNEATTGAGARSTPTTMARWSSPTPPSPATAPQRAAGRCTPCPSTTPSPSTTARSPTTRSRRARVARSTWRRRPGPTSATAPSSATRPPTAGPSTPTAPSGRWPCRRAHSTPTRARIKVGRSTPITAWSSTSTRAGFPATPQTTTAVPSSPTTKSSRSS
jgi:predicted outer membrane repeat protein